jgi:hypothetical protein
VLAVSNTRRCRWGSSLRNVTRRYRCPEPFDPQLDSVISLLDDDVGITRGGPAHGHGRPCARVSVGASVEHHQCRWAGRLGVHVLDGPDAGGSAGHRPGSGVVVDRDTFAHCCCGANQLAHSLIAGAPRCESAPRGRTTASAAARRRTCRAGLPMARQRQARPRPWSTGAR